MLLTVAELKGTYYKKAVNMDINDVTSYLARANAFAVGVIGGVPTTADETVKTAISMAFEVFAQGESAQVDDESGNITEAAATGYYVKSEKQRDPLDIVIQMLQPAKRAYEASNAVSTDRGVRFL